MRQLIARIMMPFVKRFYDNTLLQVYEGIKICELVADSSSTEKEQHLGHIIEAINLIKAYDPLRFRRIQKRLQYIVNRVCTGRGEYRDFPKTCVVDLTWFEFEVDEGHYLVLLACTLIHEATHGAVETHGIPYNKQNALRIERICDREERRFLARIGNESSGDEFDGAWWEEYWKLSEWRHKITLIKRIR